MKILYDHQIYALQKFGGINRYFDEIIQTQKDGFETARIDPQFFTPIQAAPRMDLLSRGVRFLKRKAGVPEKKGDPGLLPPQIAALFARSDFDIFHPTYYDPYFLVHTDKPFVLTVYDMIHEIFRDYFTWDDPVSHHKMMLCEKAAQIIAISQKTKDDLVTILRVPEEKVHVIPLASTFDAVSPLKPAGMEGVERYILFTGNRWGYKNFYFPVLALADILKSDPQLKLVCTGPPFETWELQIFEDQGIGRQIHHIYLNNDQTLSWMYRNAALFIFPSLYEGFGFPLLEAFGSDCPVISSTGGSLPEVAGDAALYFEPRSFAQIQEAASRVLYDPSLRTELIARGRERFRLFSWDRCRTETIEVYKKVLRS